MAWSRNSQVETLLQQVGLEFVYQTTIPISRIDFAASRRNNPRFNEALDPDIVEQYRTKLASGVDFPAPVLIKSDPNGPGNQPLLILAGNHRLDGAIRNGLSDVDAYVVTKWSQKGIDLFIRADNLTHGKGYTEEQKIEHVVFLHFRYGRPQPGQMLDPKFTVENLVREFAGEQNTSFYKKVNTAIKAREVAQVLNEKGFDSNKIISTPAGKERLAAIHEFRQKPFVLRDLATYIHRFSPDKSEIQELTETVEKISDDDETRSYLGRLTTEKADLVAQPTQARRTREKRRQHTTTYKAMVSQLLNFIKNNNGEPYKTYAEIGFTDENEIAELKSKQRELALAFKSLK